MPNNQELDRTGRRTSFYQLFSEEKLSISIPIIQRDYAQGRNHPQVEIIREDFLKALKGYLDGDQPNRDLDFIYGSTKDDPDRPGLRKFTPLDGQQRLTTLFLLHWYLAFISDNLGHLREALVTHNGDIKTGKSRFTYEVRPSSREFCDLLITRIDAGVEFTNVSALIEDQAWFFRSWKKEPTISAMLLMLDSIQNFFGFNKEYNKEYYDKLTRAEDPIITFLLLELDDFQLSDELYIKMNARGKSLTDFENFKSKLDQHISDLKPQLPTYAYPDSHSRKSAADYFSFKLDREWGDVFWKLKSKDSDTFDSELMHFIRAMLAADLALNQTKPNEPDDGLKELLHYTTSPKLAFHTYQKHKALTASGITFLISSFDALEKVDWQNLNPEDERYDWYFNESVKPAAILGHTQLTSQNRILFHAWLSHLIEHKNKPDGLAAWVRVIFNLVENSVTDGADNITRAIQAINFLLPYSDDIISALATGKLDKTPFFTGQLSEEIIKARLIIKSSEWEQVILKSEQHHYFRGQIAFLLEFAGVFDHYENNPLSSLPPEQVFSSFVDYADKAAAVFTLRSSPDYCKYVWERAVLSKGFYMWDPSEKGRYNFLSYYLSHRDTSWKRILRSADNPKDEWRKRRNYIKAVFDDKRFDIQDLPKSLEAMCESNRDDWTDLIIRDHRHIATCGQGYVKKVSSDVIFLFNASQRNHKHNELYSYDFYLKHQSDEYEPFGQLKYYTVKGTSEHPVCKFRFKFNTREYEIWIGYYPKKYVDDKAYFIELHETRGKKTKNDYTDELVKILCKAGFEECKDELQSVYFFKAFESPDETNTALNNVCNKFKSLEIIKM